MKSIRATNPRLLACLLSLSCVVAACDHDARELLSQESSSLVKCPPESPAVNLGDLPIAFVENQGQSPDEVLFQGIALGAGTLAVTADGVRLDLADVPGFKAIPAASILVHHEGASLALGLAAGSALSSTTTFVTATGTQSQVPNHGGLSQQELYPGINVELGGTARKLVTTYTVDVGASPSSIQWSYVGATDLAIDPGVGSVSVLVAGGARTLSLGPVEAHQVIQGKRIPVTGHYVSSGGILGVELDDYDVAEPVVISTRLLHSPYFQAGGTTAANGRTYAVGRGYHAGSSTDDTLGDAYVAVVDDATGLLVSTTFLIGEGEDEGHAVAVTGKGDILVAGQTRSLAFPTLGAVQGDNAGGSDGFVITLDGEGAKLLHGTYLGTSGDDATTGVTEAPGGDILVASTTTTKATPALNAEAASFVVTLPTKDPSAPAVPYVLTALDASFASIKYRFPFKGPRIRRPRAWIDCTGRARAGVFELSPPTCSPLPEYTMAECDNNEDYAQDQPSSLMNGRTTFGWGFHALRWKYYRANDALLSNATFPTLNWENWGSTWHEYVPEAAAPAVFGTGADVQLLNDIEAEQSGPFFPTEPVGTWEGGNHQDIETLVIKSALIEKKWHSPVYTSYVDHTPQGQWYNHAMVVEKTLLNRCFDPSVVPSPAPTFESLCHFPDADSWWGAVDCLSPGTHDVTFELAHFTVSTWGEPSMPAPFFHEGFWLNYSPGAGQAWYEPSELVYDPPAEELQANLKLDEAAARLASRITSQITADVSEYKGGVVGKTSTVTLTVRSIDLH